MRTGLDVYPVDRLYEEVAFVAYHFNWDRDTVLGMPHGERQRWCEEISAINQRINQESGQEDGGGMTLEQEIPDEFWEDDTDDVDDTGDVPDFWGNESI